MYGNQQKQLKMTIKASITKTPNKPSLQEIPKQIRGLHIEIVWGPGSGSLMGPIHNMGPYAPTWSHMGNTNQHIFNIIEYKSV